MNRSHYRDAVIAHLGAGDEFTLSEVQRIAREMPDVEVIGIEGGLQAKFEADSSISNLRIIYLPADLGRGAAFRVGFNESSADFVAFLDVSGSVPIETLRSYFDLLHSDATIGAVIGDRFARGSGFVASQGRRIASRAFRLFAKTLFGLRSADPQSTLKAFRRDGMMRVFESLRQYDRTFDVELVFMAQRAGLRLVDRPLEWQEGPRPLKVLRLAGGSIFSLLLLRLLHSPIGGFALLDILGRKYALPAKRSYSILIFCWRDPAHPQGGGGETYLYEQARYWASRGHRVTWFSQRFRGAPREAVVDGIRFVRWGRFPFVFGLGALWYVFGRHKSYDFVIDCMNGIPFFTPLFTTKPKVCLVYHIHSHHFLQELPGPIGRLASAVETKLVPAIYKRTPFLTISESTRAEMESFKMSAMPIGLIYSGVGPELVPGRKADDPTVLYLGRLKRYKRVRKLIDAFAYARSIVPNAKLVIAGTGDDEEPLHEYVRERGVGGVHFAGRVSDEEKVRLMQEAWVFGMPSSIEGWGIVVIEANACGTPALVFDVPGLRDCVRSGHNGLIVNGDDEFAKGLVDILSDAKLRATLSTESLEWSRKYSWARTAEETLVTIRRLQPWTAVFEPRSDGGWSFVVRESDQISTPLPSMARTGGG